MTNEELNKFFKSDKTSWYSVDSEGKKKWKDHLVEKFWKKLPLYLKLNNDEVRDLTIPRIDIFNSRSELSNIDIENLNFNNCIFLDQAYFQYPKIKDYKFSYCRFEEGLTFDIPEINSIQIESSSSGGAIAIYNSSIKSIIISHCELFESINITNCTFESVLKLDTISTSGSITFKDSYLSTEEEGVLTNIKEIDSNFIDYSWFSLIANIKNEFSKEKANNEFSSFLNSFFDVSNKVNIIEYIDREIKKGRPLTVDKDELIEKIHVLYDRKYVNYQSYARISFENVIVTQPFTFFRLNLKGFSCLNSEIEKIKFSNCEWFINNRLILATESEYFGIEDTYRQLKRMFAKNQDWEMSGYSYISEMEMRRERLGHEIDDDRGDITRYLLRYFTKKSLEYAVYYIYCHLGGYAQNFARPLSIFLISTFIGFPIIYFFLETNYTDVIWSLSFSFRKSMSNSLPLISSGLNNEYWLLETFQVIFSSILLTFIILGLRKRFKQ
jgi:hypothetical protein